MASYVKDIVDFLNSGPSPSRPNQYRERPERRRAPLGYYRPFTVRDKRANCVVHSDFANIGRRCRILLHDGYDFRLWFGLKPDKNTTVNACFSNTLEYNRTRGQVLFPQLGAGEASVRLQEHLFLFRAHLSTSDQGAASSLLRFGYDHANVYARAHAQLDTRGKVQLVAGASARNEYVAAHGDVELTDNDPVLSGTIVGQLGRVTIGVRGSGRQGAGLLTYGVCGSYSNESLDPKYGQPQDYEIYGAALDGGRVLMASYVHNMMIPVRDTLHHFSMGGEFVHRSDVPKRYNTSTSHHPNMLTVGVAWQPWHHLLLKCKGDASGTLGALIGFRTWGALPPLTVAISSQANVLKRNTVRLGLSITLENA